MLPIQGFPHIRKHIKGSMLYILPTYLLILGLRRRLKLWWQMAAQKCG
ncbi:hypothetical protein ZEAMMB73_Zm00001d034804 [Zea mays]|uniref:Uncharacterized protein n=1 Tax=Zea mays TaxID=4577 RepID=A0A1D6LBG9_MAIZE|nr:hypothetical protein ZEAMMB73_Zm00001d034804 [Zea mays]